jgi:uncharacterized DUF497 family protein
MNQVQNYQLIVRGHLDTDWGACFGGLMISHVTDEHGNPRTIIYGYVPDQAALHGILAQLRDLNLTLISVRRL